MSPSDPDTPNSSRTSRPKPAHRDPVVIHADDLDPATASVADAPPVPDLDPDAPPPGAARGLAVAGARRSLWGRIVLGALGGLITMILGLAAWDFVTGLLTRNALLGWVAFGLAVIVALGLVGILIREVLAIRRLGRIDDLRCRASDTAARHTRSLALAVSQEVTALYTGRPDLAGAVGDLQAGQPQILDADALLDATERALLTPLDAAARRSVEAAARQVATVTALVPLGLADIAIALVANVRMVRQISQIYGGRAGMLGSWRLLRAVAQHLVATGAIAAGDDLISSVAGGGMLSRISRRFGEGVVNGALTARVGIAAMEVCRPMPFEALPRPRVTRLVQRALGGLFARADAAGS